VGPRIVAAGSWIGARGGVCEFGGATVATPAEAERRARADLETGADLLKVCVTGWPAEAVAYPDSVQMGDSMLAPVLAVARAKGRPVYAHAIGQAGAVLAARAGVRALAHTPVVDSAGAAQLEASGVRVISTLATLGRSEAGPQVLASFRRLRRAGVPIVLGTDAGVLPHGGNARELLALADAGLTPIEALRAATVDAAGLLGLRDAGEIAPGSRADLVVVEGDPLTDLGVVQRPVAVVSAGSVVE
jgi:imidazolonepropionase-like amidohydrolase